MKTDSDAASDNDAITASSNRYRVVYADGLGDPSEVLICSDSRLDCEDSATVEGVCQFIQANIDMDCRRVLFVYREQLG